MNVCLVHAAVMAINEVLEKEDSDETIKALQNPAACLVDVQPENSQRYQVTLLKAKREKTAKSVAQVSIVLSCWWINPSSVAYIIVIPAQIADAVASSLITKSWH